MRSCNFRTSRTFQRRHQHWNRSRCRPLPSNTFGLNILETVSWYYRSKSWNLGSFLFRRKETPVKNTENVEGAERKEDRNAAVMSYSTLSDRNGYSHSHLTPNIYENIHDENMYDAPYEETSRDSGTYEPEPIGRTNGNMVTINGVAVR